MHKKGVGIWGTGPRRVGKDILLGGGEAGQAGAHMLYDAVYAAFEKIQMKLE